MPQIADTLPMRKGQLGLILLVILMFMGVMAVGLHSPYRVLSPGPPSAQSNASPLLASSLALTAYFPESDAKIRPLMVTGWVTGSTAREIGAKVKLTLRRLKHDFYQTHVVDVKEDGTFVAPYVQGFTSIAQDEPLHLMAEIWLPNDAGQLKRLAEEVYLNARPPLLSTVARYALLLIGIILFGVFLWAFTGKSSASKNRMAIVFSYMIIILFLALPLLAPVILPLAFPGALKFMRETPVGLVVTKADSKENSPPQWALNIGGHISRTPDPSDPEVVEVQGGLIIPLYVILLSVIGGAINMTRQVPKFQEESETQENGFIGRVVGTLLSRPPAAPPSPPGVNLSDSSTQNAQGTSSTGGATPSDPASKAREESSMRHVTWRTELLNQYMFLISAPFLAIATYYMLIGLDLTKVPVIVLVAFSVGLISEPILRTITDTAAQFLRQQPPAASHAAEAPAASK